MNYHAYLIRLWREDEHAPWHAELVVPHSNERRQFATPEQLYSFLNQQMGGERRERREERREWLVLTVLSEHLLLPYSLSCPLLPLPCPLRQLNSSPNKATQEKLTDD